MTQIPVARRAAFSLLVLCIAGALGAELLKAGSEHLPGVQASTAATTQADALSREPIQPIPEQPLLSPLKVELGERLFRDRRISRNGSVACATCHNLELAAVDRLPLSRRDNGELTEFNTPTLFNVSLNFRLFWNGRARRLEEQLEHPRDTGTVWKDVLEKLRNDSEYAPRFARAYPEGMTVNTLQDALLTFERSLITPNARFDRYLRGDRTAITREEEAGYFLFKQ